MSCVHAKKKDGVLLWCKNLIDKMTSATALAEVTSHFLLEGATDAVIIGVCKQNITALFIDIRNVYHNNHENARSL